MSGKRLATVRAFWDACSRGDWTGAGSYVGEGYVWVDHATGVVAKTPKEHQEALADDLPWSDLRFEITNAFDTHDALIVQAVRSGRLTGTWRSMETTGQHVSFEFLDIFKGQVHGRGVRHRRVVLRRDGSGGQRRRGVLLLGWGVVDGA